ncbi:MAG: response regulator [Caproiciproducens sp.]|jgi:YesN/AraC family two-component response regulator|nr:response regulator [Caproiciproducens sp.]
MDLIRVMIVDDENLAVEDLTDLLDWNALGFSIVATATNGKRALAKYKQHLPQLVITDIKMPVMDGIELIREIQHLDKNVKFLLLSAYSEFEYAKEAMRLGVKEYIIKNEINKDSFSEKLVHIRKEISYYSQTSHYFTNEFVESIMNGKETTEDQISKMKEVNESIINGKYYFIIIEEDRPLPVLFNRMRYGEQADEANKEEITRNLIGYKVDSFKVEYSAKLREGRIVVIVSQKNTGSDYQVRSAMNGICAGLIHRILDIAGLSVSAFYFLDKMNVWEAAQNYNKCKERIYIKYLREPQKVYAFDSIPVGSICEKQTPDIGSVTQALQYGDVAKVRNEIVKLYNTIKAEDSYVSLAIVSSQLFSMLEAINQDDKMGGGGFLPKIETPETLLSYSAGISHYFQCAFVKALENRNNTKSYSKEVRRAIDFIERNFADETLSIKNIADEIPLSVTRLGVIFKSEVGKTMLNYITEYRVLKAKQMLDEGQYKVYEIAEKVGYGSSQYFSQVFTNLVGISPKEYKSHR